MHKKCPIVTVNSLLERTRIMGQLDGYKQSLVVCLATWMQFTSVTDRQTDRWMDKTAIAYAVPACNVLHSKIITL